MSTTVKTCYRDTGLTAGEDIPCDPNAKNSACCGAGSTCIENLFCRDTSGDSVPGSCTDRYWGIANSPNPACPCRGHYKDDNSTLIYSDSVTFCPDGSVCCGVSNFDCCNSGKGFPRIQYNNQNVIPTGTASRALASYYSAQKVSTLPISPTGSRTAITTSTGSATGTATATGTNKNNNSAGLSTAGKAGVGIAVGLLLLACIAALYFLTRTWRKYTKLKSSKNDRSEWSAMPMPVDPSRRHETSYDNGMRHDTAYDSNMRHSQTELKYVSGRKDPPSHYAGPVELAAHGNMF